MKDILTLEQRVNLRNSAIKDMEAGVIVPLVDASYYAYGLCIGDFRDNGMAVKNTWRTGMNWTWKGPGSICLDGEVLKPGQESQEIDMDWS